MNNMDHMRISGTEPSSVILIQIKYFRPTYALPDQGLLNDDPSIVPEWDTAMADRLSDVQSASGARLQNEDHWFDSRSRHIIILNHSSQSGEVPTNEIKHGIHPE